MNIFLKFVFVLIFIVLNDAYAEECPDTKKVMAISKELRHIFNKDLCVQEVNAKNIEWIRKIALPQLMNKNFLGVAPPENWQQLSDDVLIDCYSKGNLCVKKTQDEFMQCAMSKIPLILFQLGPWINDHCVQINRTVIDGWQEKKKIILDLVNDYSHQF